MPKVAKTFTHTHEDTGRQELFFAGQNVSDELASHWHIASHLEGAEPNYAAPGNQSYAQMETDKRRIAEQLERAGDQEALAERAAFLAGVHRASSTAISATTAARGLEQAPYDGSPNAGALKKSATQPGMGRGDVEAPVYKAPQKPVQQAPVQQAPQVAAKPVEAPPKPAGG